MGLQPPVMTWISAGGYSNAAGLWDSALRPWYGITAGVGPDADRSAGVMTILNTPDDASIDVTRRGVRFHNLRHNVEDALRNADVRRSLRRDPGPR